MKKIAEEALLLTMNQEERSNFYFSVRGCLTLATSDAHAFRGCMLRASAIMMHHGKLTAADIVGERERQNQMWGIDFDRRNTANDWHSYVSHYLHIMESTSDPDEWKEALKKAAAICQAAVYCVDVHGAPAERHYDVGGNTLDPKVLKAIIGERMYQDKLSMKKLSVPEELMLIEEYAFRARRAWSTTFGDDTEAPTRDVIRKIIATGIRCLTNHGAIDREGNESC